MQLLFIFERVLQLPCGKHQWRILESRLLLRKEANLFKLQLIAGIRNIGRINKKAGFHFHAEASFSCPDVGCIGRYSLHAKTF
jgi:hypothetical protein